MITYLSSSFKSDEKLHYIGAHQAAFEGEPFYPLEIFERLAEETEGGLIESSCKVKKDRIYPVRFNLNFFGAEKRIENFNRTLDFFHEAESRADVKLDWELLQKFFNPTFDFSKVEGLQTAVDLRSEIAQSRLKLVVRIKDYPEKIEHALALHSDSDTEEFRKLLLYSCLVIGFDFYLDGRSAIELYPEIKKQEFLQRDIQQQILQVLSPQALKPLNGSSMFGVGFSKTNPDKIVYYQLENKNDLLNYFSLNDAARKVHAFYQEQPVRPSMWVGLPEREMLGGTIQNVNLYYQKYFGQETEIR